MVSRSKRAVETRGLGTVGQTKRTMLKAQGNSCLICGKFIDEETSHLDHCHRTGRARGALCSACNAGIGMFRDSTRLLEKAIRYLENDLPGMIDLRTRSEKHLDGISERKSKYNRRKPTRSRL